MTKWPQRFAVVVLVVLALFTGARLFPKSKPIVQPIAYNHHIHVEEEGLECIDCHRYVEEKPYATIPQIDVCTDCHDVDPLSDSPEEQKLIAYIEKDSTIAWNRIYEVPDHVYFSHRRHVTLGAIQCSTCHGDVAAQLQPVPEAQTPVTMEWCMDCHRQNKVSTDCLTCHR